MVESRGDEVFIGITDFAQHELGDIVFVDVTLTVNIDKDDASVRLSC